MSAFLRARDASTRKTTDALYAIAEQNNRKLPIMADSDTRVDKISVLRPHLLEYRYTLVNQVKGAGDEEKLAAEMRPYLLNGYQTSDKFKFYRANHIAIKFSYYDKNGQFITSIIAPENKTSNKASEATSKPAAGSEAPQG